MSQPSLREIIKSEYKKCIEDPIYFMKKYVKIQHPIRGTVAFALYPFQEDALQNFVDNQLNIVLKSRQMGISTLTAAYSLWLMTFHNDKNILCISITQETAKEIVTKVRFANDNLPVWLKIPCVEDNRLSLRLKNGSQIKAVSSASTAGRSSALSLLIVDECAFIDGVEEIWLSAQYTLSTGGRAIILSTPNGVGNFFHKIWVESEECKNNFKTIRLPWNLHPERDQSWRNKQTELSGVKGAAQECDCLWGESVVRVRDISSGKEFDISLEKLYSVTTRFQILTPMGYQDFFGIKKIKKDCYYTILLSNGKTIKCSDNHPFIYNNSELRSHDINVGSKISGVDGIDVVVISIEKFEKIIDLYDIVNVSDGNIFNVDGIVSHNCDFSTSGNQVVSVDILEFYKQTYLKDPIEKRGNNQDLWIWDYPNYSKNYLLTADCARGDGGDFSAFHVIDIETLEQVAEYKGQLTTKDYGNLLVSVATEYNNALLVVENNNVGWGTLQQVIDRDYQNTFYSAADLTIVDVEKSYSNKLHSQDKKLVVGFTTTSKNRPLIISNLELFFRQKQVIMKSKRLFEELNVFIWNGHKAEAMRSYNDDLVMSMGIGLWVRETALRLRNDQIAYNKAIISKISKSALGPVVVHKDVSPVADHHKTMDFTVNNKKESLTWLM